MISKSYKDFEVFAQPMRLKGFSVLLLPDFDDFDFFQSQFITLTEIFPNKVEKKTGHLAVTFVKISYETRNTRNRDGHLT